MTAHRLASPPFSGPDRDLTDSPRFVHVHIPKTGGNTLRQVLVDQFENCRVRQLNNPDAWARFRTLSPMEKLAYDVVTGHLPCGFDPALPRRFNYVCMLRHPVSRVISHFTGIKHLESRAPITKVVREKDMPLIDFMRQQDQFFFPWQFAQLFYLGWSETPVGSIEALAERAFRRLIGDIAFFGILESFDASMAYFEHRFGTRIEVAPRNLTPGEVKPAVSDEERAEIAQILKPEIAVYDMAVKVFELRLREVPDLASRIASIRARERDPAYAPRVW